MDPERSSFANSIIIDANNSASDAVKCSNRLLDEGKYAQATQEARRAITLDPHNVLSYVALSRALLKLRSFKSAADEIKRFRNHKLASAQYKLSRQCYDEHWTGKYDLVKMIEESKVSKRLDHGDYLSDSIRMDYRRDGVRGLFATRDLEPGTLLIAEKAVAAVFSSDTHLADVSDLSFNPILEPTDDPMVRRLVHSTLDTVYHRHVGGTHPPFTRHLS